MSSFTDAASSFQLNSTATPDPNATQSSDPNPLLTYETQWGLIVQQLEAMKANGDNADEIYMYITTAVNPDTEQYYGNTIGNVSTAINSLNNDIDAASAIKTAMSNLEGNPNEADPAADAQSFIDNLKVIASDPNLQDKNPDNSVNQVGTEVQNAITQICGVFGATSPSGLNATNVAVELIMIAVTPPTSPNYQDLQSANNTLSSNTGQIGQALSGHSSVLNGELQTYTTQLNQVFANEKNEYAHVVDLVTAINQNLNKASQ